MSDPRFIRIAKIDAMFTQALIDGIDWGSWMVEAANEREGLVKALRKEGHQIEHKHLARSDTGGRVD